MTLPAGHARDISHHVTILCPAFWVLATISSTIALLTRTKGATRAFPGDKNRRPFDTASPRHYRRSASLHDYHPVLWFLIYGGHKMGHSFFRENTLTRKTSERSSCHSPPINGSRPLTERDKRLCLRNHSPAPYALALRCFGSLAL